MRPVRNAQEGGSLSRNLRLYQRLFAHVRPYWREIALLLFVNLLATPIALLTPLPLKIAVDSIAGTAPLPRLYSVVPDALRSPAGLVIVTAVLMVAIALADELQSFGSWLLETYTGERLVLDFRAQLFRHLQRLSLTYHDTKGTADSIYRIQSDAPAIDTLAVDGLMPLVSSALTLVAMLIVTARIDWMLAMVALAPTPLLFWATRAGGGRLKSAWKRVKQLESSAMAVLQEVLASIRVVKAFTREDDEGERFVRKSQARLTELIRVSVLQMKLDVGVALVIAAAGAVTLAIGVLHVRAGTLTLGSLLLVMGYLRQLYSPLKTMSKKTNQLQSALASAERALAVLAEIPEVEERPDAQPMRRARGAIELRLVSFAYTSETPVLRDVSLQIPAGASVGIAGPTGAGKTTLLSLLTRFYDPTRGQILLDGVDLKQLRLFDLRNQFALVHQEPVLFSTSVAENIAYARKDASRDEIEAAARAANADQFIRNLPDGYDTTVGERGMRLSGGERQRIALARAFLKDAPVLLLDEPTSAVDTATESVIIDALDRLMAGRTTIMIAHRVSTLARCEIMLRVDHGQIVSVEARGHATAVLSVAQPGG